MHAALRNDHGPIESLWIIAGADVISSVNPKLV
jgi:hypothetical protein